MTPHEINQAIAELRGWVWYRIPAKDTRQYRFLAHPSIHEYEGQSPEWLVRADGSERICNWEFMQREGHVQHYYDDLNACKEMISALKPDQRDEFAEHLTGFWDESFCDLAGTLEWLFAATQFTAPQLCEAFLRTVGRWREK